MSSINPETVVSVLKDQIENYELDMNNIPAHIAFIMDGNGRWAK